MLEPTPRRSPRPLLPLLLALFCVGTPAGASLIFVEVESDGAGGVDGLDGAHAAVVSPDGGHLYVAADSDEAVAVFARHPATGALTFVEAEFDGAGGVDGLDGAEHLALSPDGGHLYVAAPLDGAVAVFSRDSSTGELSFVEAVFDGDPGVSGLGRATAVAVSPGGENVYVAGAADDSLTAFSRNAGSGVLTVLDVESDGAGGVDGLDGVSTVAVSPDGAHVYAAGVEDQRIGVFTRLGDGSLGFVTSVAAGLPNPELDIDDDLHLSISPDGAHVYLANHVEGFDEGWIAVFSRNAASGLLTATTPVVLASDAGFCDFGIESDSAVAFSPDGLHAYANHPFNGPLVVFSRNPASGALTIVEEICDGTIGPGGDIDGLFASQSVSTSPDGRHVYVASGNLEDAVAVFEDALFTDGFESGDLSAWSGSVP